MLPRKATTALALALILDVAAAPARPDGPGGDDRAVLATYAADTWRSLAALADRGALPADGLRRSGDGDGWTESGVTSPTDLGAYLWSVVAAEDLRLIGREEADRRLGKTLETLAGLERAHGFYFNWYDSRTGARTRTWPGGGPVRPFLSAVDNGWLAAALTVVAHARPEFRVAAEALLAPMDFGFFYDPYDPANPAAHPGLLRGGYWTDDGSFAAFHYGMLNTEPRIASYLGIARGQIPGEHYYRMTRSGVGPGMESHAYGGVPVLEGSRTYRGVRVVPSWDGTMFEALMVGLFVPEAQWAPESWGRNHPLYVRAQIEYGLRDAQLGYWGTSASCDPAGGYKAFGVAGLRTRRGADASDRVTVVTPHASFLALPYAPTEALANLKALASSFPVYGPYGFYDAVDVATGKVSDQVLALDQAMILAALDTAIGNDVLRQSFAAGPIEAIVRPLIAQERFTVGVGTSAANGEE